jgi:hypothetical protein
MELLQFYYSRFPPPLAGCGPGAPISGVYHRPHNRGEVAISQGAPRKLDLMGGLVAAKDHVVVVNGVEKVAVESQNPASKYSQRMVIPQAKS